MIIQEKVENVTGICSPFRRFLSPLGFSVKKEKKKSAFGLDAESGGVGRIRSLGWQQLQNCATAENG